jgi:hypothetical protein
VTQMYIEPIDHNAQAPDVLPSSTAAPTFRVGRVSVGKTLFPGVTAAQAPPIGLLR